MTLSLNIEKLQKLFEEHSINEIKEDEYDNICHICKEPHNNNTCTLPCNHKYHLQCLQSNIHYNKVHKCPFCTQNFNIKHITDAITKIKCNHITNSGNKCKNNAKKDSNGEFVKCGIHQKVILKTSSIDNDNILETNSCKGITLKGKPCKKNGIYDSYCCYHKKT
jgi:hypothetical protein